MYWTTDTQQHRLEGQGYIHHKLGPVVHVGEPGNEAKPSLYAKLRSSTHMLPQQIRNTARTYTHEENNNCPVL